MTYKIFISHSMDPWDKEFLDLLYQTLERYGITGYVAEYNPEYGENITEKIKQNIDSSNLILVLYTKSGQISQFVNQEIGYGIRANKKCIIMKEKDIDLRGLIYGTEVIEYDSMNPQKAISEFINYIQPLKKSKEIRDRLITLGLIAGGAYLLSKIITSEYDDED